MIEILSARKQIVEHSPKISKHLTNESLFVFISIMIQQNPSAFSQRVCLFCVLILSLTLPQVFATYPNEDYDRRNEDVDPMAASAEYELEKRVERLDLFPVELEKGTGRHESHTPPSVLIRIHKYWI